MTSARRGAVSVILPTLNEAENIVPLIERIHAAVPEVHEVIVVDDDSPDGTADIAEQYAREHTDRRIRVERRRADHGLTRSIARGAEMATGDTVVWLDCDLSMPPEDIPRLLEGIAQGHDIVAGSRFVAGGGDRRAVSGSRDPGVAAPLSDALNRFVRLVLDPGFSDYTSGFIAIRRSVLLELGLRGDYGEYFMDLIFRAIRAGFRILEVPYVLAPRERGVSKTAQDLGGYVLRGRKYVATALALRSGALRADLVARRPATRTVVRSAGWSVAGLSMLAATGIASSRPVGFDFAIYLGWALQLLAGEPLYPLAASVPASYAVGAYPYHPATPILFVPLALMPAEVASALWTAGLVALAAAIGYRSLRPLRSDLLPWALAAFVLFTPLIAEITLGNLNLATLALCLLAWDQRRRPLVSGAALALAIGLKLMILALPLFFIAAGAWRSVVWAAALGSAALAASALLQTSDWAAYLSVVPVMSTTATAAVIPIAPTGMLAQAALLLATFALTAAAGRLARDPKRADVSYAIALAAVPLAAPAIVHPYLVFAIPLLVALLRREAWWWSIPVAASWSAMNIAMRPEGPMVAFAGLALLMTLGVAAAADVPALVADRLVAVRRAALPGGS